MELSSNIIVVLKPTLFTPVFDTRGLSPQTIKAAVQAKKISDMIMSMDSERPRFMLVLPQWDLGIVLEALVASL